MGISDLTKILKEECPDCYKKLPISDLKGKRIAIDAHNLIYRYFSVQLKEELKRTDITRDDINRCRLVNKWIFSIIDFALSWLENGVTPIFVFDGQSRTEKDNTKKKRMEAKKVSRETASNLLQTIRNQDIFEINTKLIEEAKKYMAHDISIRTAELNFLVKILKEFGFPVLFSPHDAEQFCASLCVEGKVEGVFSTDSDTLTFGCSLLITDFSRQDGTIILECIDLEIILHSLNMGFSTFVDLCIMCGCDFNERIYGIGPKKSLHLLSSYGSIENIPNLDTSPLNFQKCREIFSYYSSQIKDEIDLNINITSKNSEQSDQDDSIKLYETSLKSSFDFKNRSDRFRFFLKNLPSPTSRKYSRFPSENIIYEFI
jgi:flap endonuclease-1